ncbi:DNA-binding protein [Mitsuokella multacida]|uniref:DNA-binding protein n=2 Tax=Mitsuokella multacida TaxID=52226 RepID=A0A414NWC8_9FIRM|nr:DNA-binding protein [Mitsuokella multacida]
MIGMTEEYLKQLLAEAIASVAVQPELLKLKDVATMLSLSQPSVLRLVDAGKIPFVLYESKRMYRRRDVMAYIENMETYRGRNTNGVA